MATSPPPDNRRSASIWLTAEVPRSVVALIRAKRRARGGRGPHEPEPQPTPEHLAQGADDGHRSLRAGTRRWAAGAAGSRHRSGQGQILDQRGPGTRRRASRPQPAGAGPRTGTDPSVLWTCRLQVDEGGPVGPGPARNRRGRTTPPPRGPDADEARPRLGEGGQGARDSRGSSTTTVVARAGASRRPRR